MRKKLTWLAVFVLISVNVVLVFLDEEGKVVRNAYISEWEEVYQANLYETVEADGVVSYSGESYVYFDKSLGSFDGFLVDEGKEVTVGDPLFSYRVQDYTETEALLTNQLNQISGEIAAIEDAISEMVAYDIPQPTVPVINTDDEDQTNVVIPPQDPIEAELLKEQFLIEKEQELTTKREQEMNIRTQLEELQLNGATVTVGSPYQGKVKEIASTLMDPIITIENTELNVLGELNETERVKVEQGLPVQVSLAKSQEKLNGTIREVGNSPSNEVAVDTQSVYPFEVMLDEGQNLDSVLPGYHTNLTITVDEALQAATIQDSLIHDGNAWELNKEGRLELVGVQTGIQMGEQIEVTDGLTTGDVISVNSVHANYLGMPFITPLKLNRVPWLTIGKYEDWKKYLVIGLLAR